MEDAAPATDPSFEPSRPPHALDPARLIADLRRDDPAAVAEAYRRTFGTPFGAAVLAHFMASCGVGAPVGRGVPADDLQYLAGRQDAALELMTTAGFDQASAVLAVMTDTLEGTTDDDRYSYRSRDHDDLGGD